MKRTLLSQFCIDILFYKNFKTYDKNDIIVLLRKVAILLEWAPEDILGYVCFPIAQESSIWESEI